MIDSQKYRVGENKHLFNNKELQNTLLGGINLDIYDYSSRYYDPQIGRFTTLDLLADSSRRWSPYVYAFDNPLRFIDPDGMQAGNPPTLRNIIFEGEKSSKTFKSLMESTNINLSNYKQFISFGEGTYTDIGSGKIALTKGNDIKLQIIKLTHEMSNRINLETQQKLGESVEKGEITPKEYAKQLAQSEVQGEINQIKVASEIGFRFKGKDSENVNKVIEAYSKDKTIDLTNKIVANPMHLKDYERQGGLLRENYLKKNP